VHVFVWHGVVAAHHSAAQLSVLALHFVVAHHRAARLSVLALHVVVAHHCAARLSVLALHVVVVHHSAAQLSVLALHVVVVHHCAAQLSVLALHVVVAHHCAARLSVLALHFALCRCQALVQECSDSLERDLSIVKVLCCVVAVGLGSCAVAFVQGGLCDGDVGQNVDAALDLYYTVLLYGDAGRSKEVCCLCVKSLCMLHRLISHGCTAFR